MCKRGRIAHNYWRFTSTGTCGKLVEISLAFRKT